MRGMENDHRLVGVAPVCSVVRSPRFLRRCSFWLRLLFFVLVYLRHVCGSVEVMSTSMEAMEYFTQDLEIERAVWLTSVRVRGSDEGSITGLTSG